MKTLTVLVWIERYGQERGPSESPVISIADAKASSPRDTARLFDALDKGRNMKPIGRLNREELNDRPILR